MVKFLDGIRSFVSELTNSRAAEASNYVDTVRLSVADMRAIYRTGLGNKIIRIKAGDALKDTLQFESTDDEEFYRARLAAKVKGAARWCLAFGRGIVVIHHRGEDLVTPLGKVDPARVLLSVFSGDMVVASKIDLDLQSPTYYKPLEYTTRGQPIHHTRVVDFTYVRPPELELPAYRYGGISEFELVYEQIIADGVVQRACPRIIDKASTLFYKVPGFADAMQSGNSSAMVAYFRQLENIRGIMSAGLVDKEDDIEAISQSITNLADADQITLRRLAMVTGISVTRLIGEAPRGMNSTGEKEAQMDQDMLETLQSDYFLEPINELMRKLGQGRVSFRENQGQTPNDRLDYETKAIDNAVKLAQLGEDHGTYLTDHGVIKIDEYDSLFSEADWANVPAPTESTESEDPDAADPTAALNGAQVTSLLDIFEQVRVGTISKITAARLIALAFPVSEAEGARLVSDIEVSPMPVLEQPTPDA